MSYEFVPKAEYEPVRIELEAIIRKVQNILRDEIFTFQYQLVVVGKSTLLPAK